VVRRLDDEDSCEIDDDEAAALEDAELAIDRGESVDAAVLLERLRVRP